MNRANILFMQFNRKNPIRICLVLLLQYLGCLSALAASDPVQTFPLLGSKDSVKVNYISTVTDYQNLLRIANPSLLPLIEPNTTHITNIVSVGIEEDNKSYIQSDFKVTIVLHVKKYTQSLDDVFEQFDSTFIIDYKKGDAATYNAVQYLAFENVYKVEVKIVSITPDVTSWDVSKVLRVDNTMQAARDYVFDCSKAILGLNVNPDNINGELSASWSDPNNGQTEYDLEWAWIDSSAAADYQVGGQFLQDKLFSNNATRVTINTSGYNIPLLYDGAGKLFVRVRPAQIKIGGRRVEGEWTWINNITSEPVSYAFSGHQDNLNWQASTSYAEDGKRKSVVQYFDGTLRGRQTVTKDNTTGTTVVAESFYDYQGRPVIQVLPAPTLNTIIEYSENFNKSINDAGYPKWAYDKLNEGATICGNPALPLSTVTGTAKYYSPGNELNTISTGYNVNKYIPNSEGTVAGEAYPFTETRFTPDGRIATQGGVGYTYQLGSGHETKYFYESPAQEELDALFGTDAGVASHYFKSLVKDANGQYSVSYTDMHGRTVATALAGDAPKNSDGTNRLDALSSINTKSFTKQLLDDETNRIIGKSIVSSKSLIAPKAGSYEFNYQLNPDQLKLVACTHDTICYDCLYNLKITINSDCNGVAGFPYTVVDSNFTVGGVLASPVCSENGKTPGFFNKLFTVPLPEGAYTVTKTLSLSDSAQNTYRDVFFTNDTCKKFIDFYNEAYEVLASKSNCAITCSACDSAIGHDFAGFRANFVLQTGLQEPLSDSMVSAVTAAYNNARANCDRICNNIYDDGLENIRSIRQMMLLDVSPSGGQYANPAIASDMYGIFSSANAWAEVFNTGKPAYQNPINYTWNAGTVSVDNNYKNDLGQTATPPNLSSLSPQEFSDRFQSSWAEQLLPHHPEYCKLKTTMEQLPATYHFEADLNKLNTWSDMVAATSTPGQYITGILDKDPFFSNTSGDAPGSAYYTGMHDAITNYVQLHYGPTVSCPATTAHDEGYATLWQIVQSSVFCRSADTLGCENSDQSNCLRHMPPTPLITPTTGCAGDWDKIWITFRSLYLSRRQQFISQYLKDQCPNVTNASLIQQGKSPRFIDFSDNTGTGGIDAGDLNTFFSQVGNGDPASVQTGKDLLKDQYDSTCLGYANTWIAQLSECDMLSSRWENQATKTTDSTWLVDRLRDVCKNGSDEDHYLGSSSINPNIPNATQYGFSDFPGVVRTFFQNNGITPPVTASCNPYLITIPKPYDKQPALTDELIVTKPTPCECDRLSALKAEYTASGYAGTFPEYLQYNYGTTITQGAIDTLTSLCDGSYTCVFLPNPITLPPALQCRNSAGYTAPPCIDCIIFKRIQDSFQVVFNQTAPLRNPQTAGDTSLNIAFQNYANNQTGFNKNWADYAAFMDTCGHYECDSLESLKNKYIDSLKHGRITHQLLTQEGVSYTNLTQMEHNGTIYFPDSIRSKPDTWYNNYGLNTNNGDHFCTNNGYSVEIRFKDSTSSRWGDVFYTGLGPEPIDPTSPLFDVTLDRDHCDTLNCNPGTYIPGLYIRRNGIDYILDTNPTTSVITNWITLKIKILPNMNYLYYNGNLIIQEPRDSTKPIGYKTGFGLGIFGRQGMIDYVKVYDNQDSLKYFEDFNSPASPAFIDPSFICNTSYNCQSSYTSYFNTKEGTSYTFSQIDSLYRNKCGIPLNVCDNIDTLPQTLSGVGPRLCGLNEPVFQPLQYVDEPCKDLDKIAYTTAEEKWQLYTDSIRNVFDTAYYNKCMSAKNLESFTVKCNVSEYHYTLYYYDQAGNLVQTVPPEGIDDKHGDAAFLDTVKAVRLRVKNGESETGIGNVDVPAHTLLTQYRYNTLDQVIAQKTPDAGNSKFWYDMLGRLVVSQNAKQQALNKYSYTLYDELGRITEVGQKPQSAGSISQAISRDKDQLNTWLAGGGLNKEQITRTRYDLSYNEGDNSLGNLPVPVLIQRNLRNRVSYSMVYDIEPNPANTLGTHTAGTFYTYDIHGNVDTLVQDFNTGIMKSTGNRFKKVVYDYDLISGKVNQVAYQPGFIDEFYHKYVYDAENRITDVLTSHDKLIWEKDARYSYYKHGPLARTIIGQQQVQGLDYAYTLQGWLKGVNSSDLNTTDDIGQDALPAGTVINQVAKDVYGFNLNYFNGDYNSISSLIPFAVKPSSLPASTTGEELFNGNINSMAVNIPKLGKAQLYGYRYDQLNRIVAMDAFTGLNADNTWTPIATDNYKERVTYDANGNILTYKRNGANTTNNVSMDDLSYGYNYELDPVTHLPVLRNGNKILLNNRLRHVKDAVTTPGGDDIKNQDDDNYNYDEIGNLTKDTKESISNINWNVYGKILTITKPNTTINYSYDAAGNRVSKTVSSPSGVRGTFYVRDASGNVMSVYGTDATVNSGDLTQNEVHLYGSSRLGIFNVDRDVQNITVVNYSNNINTFTRGKKFFELSNHLGNVLVTISDRKIMMLPDDQGCTAGTANDILNVYTRNNEPSYVARQEVNILDGFESINDDDFVAYTDNSLGACAVIDPVNPPAGSYYRADVITANDYYPFGMMMPGRKYSIANTNYRYGFNGKESDNDVKGEGNQIDYGLRIYDSRLGKFVSVDPLTDEYPFFTPYQFAGNNPVRAVDLDGAEGLISMFLPNPFSEENTAKLKNNLGVKKGSWADKVLDFVSGAGNRSRDLNNPITYVNSAGDHLKNMYNNAKGIVTAKNPRQALNSTIHLGLPSLNASEQMGQRAVTAAKTGDYRTMGALFTDASAFVATMRVAMIKTGFNVDLMGGETSKLGSKYLNYDLNAKQGIRANVDEFGEYFEKETVSEIVVNNPQAEFLQQVAGALKKGAKVTVRGQMANKFFKEIWNGKAKGLEEYDIKPGSQKTGLPTGDYKTTEGQPLQGENNINEIILTKKP